MGEAFTLRPPGFSLLLTPLVATRGLDFATLNLLVSVLGIFAVVLFFLLLVPRTGALVACTAALTVWLSPTFQQLCNQILSDVPGLAAALGCLLLLRWSDRVPSAARDVLVGVAVALACYLRTANLLLVPALLLDRLLARRLSWPPGAADLRRILLPGLVAVALYAPWALRPQTPLEYAQESLRSYADAVLRVDSVDGEAGWVGIEDLASRVVHNLRRYAAAIAFDPATSSPTAPAWAVLVLGVFAWLVVLLRRREAPEWFAGLSFAAIALYYVAQARLALLPFVLFFAASVEVLQRVLAALLPRRAASVVVAVGLLLLASSGFTTDFMRPRSREKYVELLALADHLANVSSADEPLGGDNGSAYALLLDRPVYGLQFLCNQRGIPAAREAIARWRLTRVVVQRDGPCEPLIADGHEEGSFAEFAVVQVTQEGADPGPRSPRAASDPD